MRRGSGAELGEREVNVWRWDRLPSAWGIGLLALLSCSVLGRSYPVSPVLSGRVEGMPPGSTTLELQVSSRDGGTLGARRELELGTDGAFRFEPIRLNVAGLERGHRYRAWLSARDSAGDARIIWRAEWAREAIFEPVELVCALARPHDEGQPCQVQDATSQRWLVDLGEREFRRSCSSCHGFDATGDGPAAVALKTAPADLTRIAARRGGRFDRVDVFRFIDGRGRVAAHGSREMPVWGARLSTELDRFATSEEMASARIDAIVSYLESLQDPLPPPRL